MPNTKELPVKMNGFKILKDLGFTLNGIRYAKVICKACKNEFKTSVYHIHTIESCGCLGGRKAKKLPDFINGFKILKDFGYNKGSRRALVICKVCKREYEVDPNKLKDRSHCGCIRHGSIACKYTKSHPQLTQCYKHMKSRCYNENNQDYYNYGAKGVRVCNEWKKDRNKFVEWAIDNGYEYNLSLDRIDNSKGYNPENCRWVSKIEQARNTGRNVLTMELAIKIREDYKMIQEIKKYKLGRPWSLYDLAKHYKVSYSTIWTVVKNKSWKP